VRYYQRVVVSDADPGAGEIDVSAFISIALEGHMLCLEFISAALLPVQAAFRIANRLPGHASRGFLAKTAHDTARTAFRDIVTAPILAFTTMRAMLAERWSLAAATDPASGDAHCDLGARVSVRELAAASSPRTSVQRLDVTKYTQLIERWVTETVRDFLTAKHIDLTAYTAAMQTVASSAVSIPASSPGNGDGTEHPNIPAARTATNALARARDLTRRQQR
jgi:hypothetical protein